MYCLLGAFLLVATPALAWPLMGGANQPFGHPSQAIYQPSGGQIMYRSAAGVPHSQLIPANSELAQKATGGKGKCKVYYYCCIFYCWAKWTPCGCYLVCADEEKAVPTKELPLTTSDLFVPPSATLSAELIPPSTPPNIHGGLPDNGPDPGRVDVPIYGPPRPGPAQVTDDDNEPPVLATDDNLDEDQIVTQPPPPPRQPEVPKPEPEPKEPEPEEPTPEPEPEEPEEVTTRRTHIPTPLVIVTQEPEQEPEQDPDYTFPGPEEDPYENVQHPSPPPYHPSPQPRPQPAQPPVTDEPVDDEEPTFEDEPTYEEPEHPTPEIAEETGDDDMLITFNQVQGRRPLYVRFPQKGVSFEARAGDQNRVQRSTNNARKDKAKDQHGEKKQPKDHEKKPKDKKHRDRQEKDKAKEERRKERKKDRKQRQKEVDKKFIW